MKKLFINRRLLVLVGPSNRKTVMLQFGLLLIVAISIVQFSCQKFIDIDPPKTEITNEIVFSSDESAESAIIGIYSQLINEAGGIYFASGGSNSVTYLSGLSSDELSYYGQSLVDVQFNTNSLVSRNAGVFSLWEKGYKYIFYVNSALSGLSNSTKVSNALKRQLEGEAKFIRAFVYFYLVNLYGDIPVILSTNLEENRTASRKSPDIVFEQIKSDLEDAKNLLSSDYAWSQGERIRANRYVAIALLSRVHLYMKDWANAEIQATEVINNSGTYTLVSDLNDCFLQNNTEAIWQLSHASRNAIEGLTFTIPPGTMQPRLSLSSHVISAFETGDNRRMQWLDSIVIGGTTWYYPFKYKLRASGMPITEYSTVIRLAEQYLIRAEARAQQNNIGGAQSDINAIRQRAGLGITVANDKVSVLLAIEQERRVELFTEWGHRWLDLKRTNRADIVLGPIKLSNWQSSDALYPIPQSEIDVNKNLLPQNFGY